MLHEDCWDLALGGCPTLGCASRLRVVVSALEGATTEMLIAWIFFFAGVFAALALVVPAFAKMFTETGLNVPWYTQILLDVSRFAQTPLGWVAGMATLLAPVVLYVRARRRPIVRSIFSALILLDLLFVPFAIMALFMALTLPQKL